MEIEDEKNCFVSNLSYLLEREIEKIDQEIEKEHETNSFSTVRNLVIFTSYSFFRRIIHFCTPFSFFPFKIIPRRKHAYAIYDQKHWHSFSFLSDYVKTPFDKKNLIHWKGRYQEGFLRSIRIAASLFLDRAYLLLSYEKNPYQKSYHLNYLVMYQKEGQTKILNYANNLIMEKDSYFSLFDVHLLGKIPQLMLYQIHEKSFPEDFMTQVLFSILFSEEIQNDFGKKNPNFVQKYDEAGIHFSFSELYYQHLGVDEKKDYTTHGTLEFNDIHSFTLQPSSLPRSIQVVGDHTYCYKGKYHFTLLSDSLPEEAKEFREVLLSERRLHFCHLNSANMAFVFEQEHPYIVFGMIPMNEAESFHHSWVEKEDEVIDFNLNIIMKKEDYYQMYQPIVLQKTSIEEYCENCFLLIHTLQLPLEPFLVNSVGPELKKDFMKRNAFLVEEKENE